MAGVKGHSGGARPGAGRKPKTAFEREVTGNPGHRGRVLSHPGAGQAVVATAIDEAEAPDDLTMDERHVWLELAPHAIAARTLTPATSLAFRVLCRNVVLERALSGSAADRGGSDHRGMIQRVDAELARFCLAPFGKSIFQAEPDAKPANPLEKFLKRG